jgi:hypothetical protein
MHLFLVLSEDGSRLPVFSGRHEAFARSTLTGTTERNKKRFIVKFVATDHACSRIRSALITRRGAKIALDCRFSQVREVAPRTEGIGRAVSGAFRNDRDLRPFRGGKSREPAARTAAGQGLPPRSEASPSGCASARNYAGVVTTKRICTNDSASERPKRPVLPVDAVVNRLFSVCSASLR